MTRWAYFLESFAKDNTDQIILEILEDSSIDTSKITIESMKGLRQKSTIEFNYTIEVNESSGPYKISDTDRFKKQVVSNYENKTFIDPSETVLRTELCNFMVIPSPKCKT